MAKQRDTPIDALPPELASAGDDTMVHKLYLLIRQAVEESATDVHLRAGAPPRLRVEGELFQVKGITPKEPDLMSFFNSILDSEQMLQFKQDNEFDCSHTMSGLCRMRINLYRQRGKFCAALRIINSKIPSMEDIRLPAGVTNLTKIDSGLVLAVGPTGSGKSTTLAAMINSINATRRCHILTIEDPIEYQYEDKKAMVSQRELSQDTASFAAALRHSLRQDPDVVLIGEMRDAETIALAITLAETGHLTFSTLHTANCTQTLTRIIDVFPPHQQEQMRLQLSLSLAGVVAQRLVRRKDQKGLVAAREVLIGTRAVRNLIREAKYNQIFSAIQTGVEDGMITMENSLGELVREGYIDFDTAIAVAPHPADFRQKYGNLK